MKQKQLTGVEKFYIRFDFHKKENKEYMYMCVCVMPIN